MQEIGSHPNVVTILDVCTEQGSRITYKISYSLKSSSFIHSVKREKKELDKIWKWIGLAYWMIKCKWLTKSECYVFSTLPYLFVTIIFYNFANDIISFTLKVSSFTLHEATKYLVSLQACHAQFPELILKHSYSQVMLNLDIFE